MQKIIIAILFLGLNSIIGQSPINSLDFDGTNDYVSTSLPTIFNDISNNDFTIETWIKPNSNGFCRVLYAQFNSSNFASLSLGTSNEIYFYVNNVTGEKTSTTLPLGVWSHVACTWDASTGLTQTYINGTLEITSFGGSSSTGNDNLMTIGSKTDGSQLFTGELDEMRIWDVIRSECQITGSMNSEFTLSQNNLIAYYNYNQGAAGGANTGISTLPDFTTNYDGTLNNFGLTGASSNWLSSNATINALNQTSGLNSTDVITTCDSITWIDGITYTSSNNIATFTLITANGCDSIITLDLTVNGVLNSVTQVGNTLTADEVGASYQWLNCPNMTPIIGATNQLYTATANGDYAVIISNNTCSDTSSCYAISNVGVLENAFKGQITSFPNPNNGDFSIDLGKSYDEIKMTLKNISGQLLFKKQYYSTAIINYQINAPNGVYIIELENSNGDLCSFKIVKQ